MERDAFLTLRLPKSLHRKVKKEAKETQRTDAGLVRWVLQEHFDNQAKETA